MPFDLLEWREGVWEDLGVGLEDDGTTFVWWRLGPTAAPPPAPPEDHVRRVRMPANEPWLAGLAKAHVSCAVVVDYGEAGPARDVRAFHGHDFAEPLAEPGSVDLTADVDFTELGEQAARHGFATTLETQERFLLRHGVLEAINKIDRTSLEGNSNYLRLRQLLLPTGFGSAFKVARLTRAAATASPPPTASS